jgi:two-component system, sensor histidine kinase and response regulator
MGSGRTKRRLLLTSGLSCAAAAPVALLRLVNPPASSLAVMLAAALALLVLQVYRARCARQAAVAASSAKAQFLANMSHEIRTPLNGIMAMAEMLEASDLDPPQREMTGIIRTSAECLIHIVSDILDLSRIDGGKVLLSRVPFDLHGTIHGVVGQLAPVARAKGLRLECDVAPSVPRWIEGDPERFRRVLMELTSNALKFTQEGSVRLETVGAGDPMERSAILCKVIDTGIGIKPKAMPKLFEPFTQADSSSTRRHGGAGLGLAISLRIVTLMGGSMGVDSTPRGGSTFWLLLPP